MRKNDQVGDPEPNQIKPLLHVSLQKYTENWTIKIHWIRYVFSSNIANKHISPRIKIWTDSWIQKAFRNTATLNY